MEVKRIELIFKLNDVDQDNVLSIHEAMGAVT